MKVVVALLAGAVLGAAATRLLRPSAPAEIAPTVASRPGPARVVIDLSDAG